MSAQIEKVAISDFINKGGVRFKRLDISFQLFGKALHEAPLIVIVHALTGNSDVAGETKGWWKTLVGKGKLLDTDKYTVLGFNIPGNAYDGVIIEDYESFTAFDIATLFNKCLRLLDIKQVYAALGGSLGGCIVWEMLAREPDFFKYVIPLASDWKSSDWIIGQNYVQQRILENSKSPIYDARIMAMLFYRSQLSFKLKFGRSKTGDNSMFNIESWLNHHGNKLQKRFSPEAYKMMNHLLSTVDITKEHGSFENAINGVSATIIQININSDLMFVPEECQETASKLDQMKIKNRVFIIDSVHGHDAFLIEHEQIISFLQVYF
jgi:homoserine O-acetyltransferase